MRDILLDILKQTSIDCKAVCITVNDRETIAECHDKEGNLFVYGVISQPLFNYNAKLGMANTKLLYGLLNFANYQTDDASISVTKKEDKDGSEWIEQFEFRNPVSGNNADFRMMHPSQIPVQAVFPTIAWDIDIQPTKSKITELQQIIKMYADVDSKEFGIRTIKGDCQFFIGDENSSTHRISMTMEKNINGTVKVPLLFPTSLVMTVLGLVGFNVNSLRVSNRGILSMSVDTQLGKYTYYIRANNKEK
jgi:hypothetical protein